MAAGRHERSVQPTEDLPAEYGERSVRARWLLRPAWVAWTLSPSTSTPTIAGRTAKSMCRTTPSTSTGCWKEMLSSPVGDGEPGEERLEDTVGPLVGERAMLEDMSERCRPATAPTSERLQHDDQPANREQLRHERLDRPGHLGTHGHRAEVEQRPGRLSHSDASAHRDVPLLDVGGSVDGSLRAGEGWRPVGRVISGDGSSSHRSQILAAARCDATAAGPPASARMEVGFPGPFAAGDPVSASDTVCSEQAHEVPDRCVAQAGTAEERTVHVSSSRQPVQEVADVACIRQSSKQV